MVVSYFLLGQYVWTSILQRSDREALTMVFASFLYVLSLSLPLGSQERTSQSSNICHILSPLHHAYFRPVALAVFSCQTMFDLRLLLWFLLLGTWTWLEQTVPMNEGLSFHLSIFPIVCPSIHLSIHKNWLIWFFWDLV